MMRETWRADTHTIFGTARSVALDAGGREYETLDLDVITRATAALKQRAEAVPLPPATHGTRVQLKAEETCVRHHLGGIRCGADPGQICKDGVKPCKTHFTGTE